MISLFNKLFEKKDMRFIREVDELLNSDECSIDTEMILQVARRKVKDEKEYYLEGEKFVRNGLAKILLSPNKTLTVKEIEYLHKLQGRAGGKYKAGGRLNVSIDEIKERLKK